MNTLKNIGTVILLTLGAYIVLFSGYLISSMIERYSDPFSESASLFLFSTTLTVCIIYFFIIFRWFSWQFILISAACFILSGIIVSMILTSLNTPIRHGPNTNIKGALVGIRVQSALFYDENGNSYGSTTIPAMSCFAIDPAIGGVFFDQTVREELNDIKEHSKSDPTCALSVEPQAWAVSAPLVGEVGDKQKHWCVDSNGASYQVDRPITEAKCPSPSPTN